MLPITSLYPQPRPVTLGDRTFLVGEMRVADLIALQDWLDRRWESPLEAIRAGLDAMGERERGAALRGIWDACDAGPPLWGGDRAAEVMRTEAGIAQVFRAILGGQFGLDDAAIRPVAEATTPEQYRAMLRAWRRVEPADEVQWMLGIDTSGGGSPVGWPQAICEVCEAFGWTLEYVRGLTISQVRAARAGGKPQTRGVAAAPGTVKQEQAKMRARMNGHAASGKGGSDGG